MKIRFLMLPLATILSLSPQSSSAQKLTVSGTSEIKHFDTLDVQDNGDLIGNSFRPARVNPGERIQIATNFKADAIAGAKVRFKGLEVAKVNGAGTAVVQLNGLPVGPQWLPNLSKPKEPIKLGVPMTMNDAVLNADNTSGAGAKKVKPTDVASSSELDINCAAMTIEWKDDKGQTQRTQIGFNGVAEVRASKCRIEPRAGLKLGMSELASEVTVTFKVLGQTRTYRTSMRPGESKTAMAFIEHTAANPGKIEVSMNAEALMVSTKRIRKDTQCGYRAYINFVY